MVAMTKVSPPGPRFSVCSIFVISTCFSSWASAVAEDRAAGVNDDLTSGVSRATVVGAEGLGVFGEEMRCQIPIAARIITTPANAATYFLAGPSLRQTRPNARMNR